MAPFVINTLGKETYSIWVLVTTFSVFGYLNIIEFGIQGSIVKYVAEYRAKGEVSRLNGIINTGMTIYIILGLVAAAVITIFAFWGLEHAFKVPPEQVGTARILLFIVAAQTAVDFPSLAIQGVLEGIQGYNILYLVGIGRTVIYAILTVLFLTAGYGLVALATIVSITTIIGSITMGIYILFAVDEWRPRLGISGDSFRKLLSFSTQLFLIRINAIVYNLMDKTIIGALLATTLLTDYDIANRIQSYVLVSVSLISSMLVPMASGLDASGKKEDIQKLLITATKFTVGISLPITLGVMVLAESFIHYWIGIQYVSDAGITRLFLVYLIIAPMTVVGYNLMIGMGRLRQLVIIQFVSTIVNLGLSLTLARSMGVAGVIVGTLVGTVIAFFPYLRLFLRSLDLTWSRLIVGTVVPTYPLGLVLALVLMLITRVRSPASLFEVGLYGMLFAAVYYGFFYFLGMTKSERRAAKGLARGFATTLRNQINWRHIDGS